MQCQADNDLNEGGIKQALEAKKVLENIEYDLVISSPFIRARKTAEIANNGRKPLIIEDKLRERNGGVLDGQILPRETILDFFNYNKDIQCEGAEGIQDFCKRVWEYVDEVKEKYKDKNIVLVTHNIVIRAMRAYIIGMPEDGDIEQFGIKNGEVIKLI